MFFARAHTEIERPDKSVIAGADVLKIDKQNIDTSEHLPGRFAVFAVKAVNGNA